MGKRRSKSETVPARSGEPARPAPSPWARAPHPLLAALALVLLVAGARWWLIGQYGVDVPWLDQWDAEAQGLYRPWKTGTLDLHAWFAPHNEHRIFFTRVLSLGLFWANGQWDPRLQMVANAGLYALVFGALFLILRRGRTPGFQLLCWLVLAVLGSAPYGSTNTLLGFQSQFYFLAGFSLLAIYGLINGRPGSPWWIVGVASGCAALVSMASGYAAALAALIVIAGASLRSIPDVRQELARKWPSILVIGGLVLAGVLLRYSPPDHAALAAKSAADFFRFLLACLSWPGSSMLPLALLCWLPFVLFAVQYLRRQAPDGDAERFILGIGCWVLLQSVALALYRGSSPEGLESRYTDLLAFGLLANALCAVWLFGSSGLVRRIAPALAVVWFVGIGIALYSASFDGRPLSWKQPMEIRRGATAAFLATDDQRYLDQAPPYGDVNRLAAMLRDESIRPVLPAGIRKGLPLVPASGSPAPDLLNGVSVPNLQASTPGLGTFPGMFSRFAIIPPSTKFEYRIQGQGALPFLMLYTIGDGYSATLADSGQKPHRIVTLPGGGPGERHAFAYCPSRDCVIQGSSGPAQLAIREPKEVGFLSLAAWTAAAFGSAIMALGAVLFLALLAMVRRAPRPIA